MWRLYWRLVWARIRAQMQYRVSFALDIGSFAVMTGLEFAVVLILFSRFRSVGGWTVGEVALLYGLSSIAFGLSEMIARGFDSPFEAMMAQGSFDTLLARPLPAFFQVLASEFQLRRLGRVFQGLLVLGFALTRVAIDWTPAKVLLVPLTIASGGVIFGALVVMGATICFWTIRTPEVINAFTYGGQELTSYPMSIYNRAIRLVFFVLVPVGFVNYPAALVLLDRADPLGFPSVLAWAAPLVAAAFSGVALLFWRFGVAKYASTGT